MPDGESSGSELTRRRLLRNAGVAGAGAAAAGLLGAPAMADDSTSAEADRHGQSRPRIGELVWLAGDHHLHTRYSPDGLYRVEDHVKHASAYGLDWVVVNDHGGPQHARFGAALANVDIRAARAAYRDMLVFQGLEWNMPGAEHGTVFVHPGPDEVAVLTEFENAYDGIVRGATASTAANEALAIAGLDFLADAVGRQRVADALVLANHPARRGIDSPHELRGWRDAQPRIAVGMEGAPGHQPAGIKVPSGPGLARGAYALPPSPDSFPGYPIESYRTFGGFDWMTATVGGLWDSMLAEGVPWWITASSDSHFAHADSAVRGPNSNFLGNGFYNEPVYGTPADLSYFDFWPGYYSRTQVGATHFSYAAVMAGIRAGRVWVDQGGLIAGLDVRAGLAGGPGSATLGDTLRVPAGASAELTIAIDVATRPNWAQFVPALARVDIIGGEVT
ncbi:MAG TPA: PHP domain-containing protein, partial [Micromonosporaceae bacterium]|nr:PHP domain-containing protein [Micromonosporaceae bacterium]